MQQFDKQNEEKTQNLPRIATQEYPIGFVNSLSVNSPEKKSLPAPFQKSILTITILCS